MVLCTKGKAGSDNAETKTSYGDDETGTMQRPVGRDIGLLDSYLFETMERERPKEREPHQKSSKEWESQQKPTRSIIRTKGRHGSRHI